MKQMSLDFSPPTQLNSSPSPSLNSQSSDSLKREPAREKAEEENLDQGSEELTVYRVSQLNKVIRQLLEGEFQLLWIQGEISNFKAHPSGHFYFSLKDEKAQVSAVMFKGFNRHLKFKPGDGLEVLVRGKVTVYEPRGNYQIFCEVMEPLGAGSLQLAFEQLKEKLQKEGLFSLERKLPLPLFPEHVALVTATSGAAIRDMIHVLNRRSRGLRITVVPALVQGERAPASIVEGIRLANQLGDVDVIIVGRGGGSIEDLWGFNDERVARAIAASQLPVISAVGHEVDFTIADFVADLRAPTPSAAAEVVVKNSADLVISLQTLGHRLQLAVERKMGSNHQCVDALIKRLVDPRRRLRDLILRCDELIDRLMEAMRRNFKTQRSALVTTQQRLGSPLSSVRQLEIQCQFLTESLHLSMKRKWENSYSRWQRLTQVLDSLSPLKVVERGYAVVRDRQGHILKSVEKMEVNQEVEVQMRDGWVNVQVNQVNPGTERLWTRHRPATEEIS